MVMVTTGSVRFVPKPEDNGKYVSCRATNPHYPAITKEDGYIVKVHCEYNTTYPTHLGRPGLGQLLLSHFGACDQRCGIEEVLHYYYYQKGAHHF